MGFAEQFFGKSIHKIDAADILHFFRQNENEGPHLEFKSGKVQMGKILKEISAFLNAEGGLLIVGAPRESDLPGMEEERHSFGEPDPSFIADPLIIHEAIQNIIVPKALGIEIAQVRFNEGSVFLVEVLPSNTPPHQVGPVGTYYLRDGAVSRPANHLELEHLFFQRRMPDLQLKIALERLADSSMIYFGIINRSTKSALRPYLQITVEPVISKQGKRRIHKIEYSEPYLPKGPEWLTSFEVNPSHPVIYLRVDYCCEDVALKTKAAFISIEKREAKLLQVYDSEVELHFNAMDFYYQYSYLLG